MQPRKIFVRAPNWLGDFVMATASFARIRAGFPNAHITCGMRPYLRELTSGAAWFDAIVDTPRARGLRGLSAQVRALRALRVDLAVILPNSLETALVPFLARVPMRLGYRQGRRGLLTHGPVAPRGRGLLSRHGPRRVPTPMPMYYAALLDELELPAGGLRGVLAITASERADVDAWLRSRGIEAGSRVILITAGASYGASKLWLPERFVAVARHFASRGDVPVFLAGPAEVAMADELASRAGAGTYAATRPVLPLGALKALVERASLMITTDTGPRHVALALGIPVVCLMGPNDPRYTDYARERSIVLRRELPCSPCQRKVCPLGHQDCMRLITVADVLDACERALSPGAVEARTAERHDL